VHCRRLVRSLYRKRVDGWWTVGFAGSSAAFEAGLWAQLSLRHCSLQARSSQTGISQHLLEQHSVIQIGSVEDLLAQILFVELGHNVRFVASRAIPGLRPLPQ
jgi:hypothetical protein